MIMLDDITETIIAGLTEHLSSYAITRIIERDQKAPRPAYPFIGFKWISLAPDRGPQPNRTVVVVQSTDPEFEHDIMYTYVRNPTMTLSVTVYDAGDSDKVSTITMATRDWFQTPELANDWLDPLGAVVSEVVGWGDRDTQLDRDIERRQGFDVRIRVVDEVEVRVPTIETVAVSGPDGTDQIDL